MQDKDNTMRNHWQRVIGGKVTDFVNKNSSWESLDEEHKDFLREVREIREKAVREIEKNTKKKLTTIDLLNLLNKQGYSYTNKFFLHLFDYLYSSDVKREYIIKFAQFCLTEIPAGFKELKHQNYANIDMVSILKTAAKGDYKWLSKVDYYKACLYCTTSEKFIEQCMSAEVGDYEVICTLLARKADPNLLSETVGKTPFMITIENSNFLLSQLLLDQKADVNLCDKAGYSIVNIICKEDGPQSYNTELNIQKLKLLTKYKVKLDQSDQELQRTPLHWSCINDNLRITKYLLSKGASANAIDSKGKTPLHYACENYNLDAFWSLIEYSADVNIRDQEENSVFVYLDRILTRPTAQTVFTEILFKALRKNNKEVAELAVIQNIDVKACDKSGNTPLHLTYQLKDLGAAFYLLVCKANPNAQNLCGNTPLHEACRTNNINLARLLLDHKADLNIVNYIEETPYNIAFKLDYKEVLELLDNKSKQLLPHYSW